VGVQNVERLEKREEGREGKQEGSHARFVTDESTAMNGVFSRQLFWENASSTCVHLCVLKPAKPWCWCLGDAQIAHAAHASYQRHHCQAYTQILHCL